MTEDQLIDAITATLTAAHQACQPLFFAARQDPVLGLSKTDQEGAGRQLGITRSRRSATCPALGRGASRVARERNRSTRSMRRAGNVSDIDAPHRQKRWETWGFARWPHLR
jgi:hypothetical protein